MHSIILPLVFVTCNEIGGIEEHVALCGYQSLQREGQVVGLSELEAMQQPARLYFARWNGLSLGGEPAKTLLRPQRILRISFSWPGQPVRRHGKGAIEVPQREGNVYGGPEDPRLRPALAVFGRTWGRADEDGSLSAGCVCHLTGCGGEAQPWKPKGRCQICTLVSGGRLKS